MTVENEHFRAFFRMVLQKLTFSGKRGRFRAKGHEVKVVGNAILKTFYLMTFSLGCFLQPQMTVEICLFLFKLTNIEHFSERCFKNWQFVAKGDILERQVLW